MKTTVLVLIMISGCATRPLDVRDALVNGRQSEVDEFSKRVLAGEALITAEMLDDERQVNRAIIVRLDRGNGTAQYGVDLVSDYFMCVLQARKRQSSRQLIAISPSDTRCSIEDACEVCNSLTYPLPTEVREALRSYWRAHLSS